MLTHLKRFKQIMFRITLLDRWGIKSLNYLGVQNEVPGDNYFTFDSKAYKLRVGGKNRFFW